MAKSAVRILRVLLALALPGVFLVAVVAASPAAAADSCGTDWHKQTDGVMRGSASKSLGGRTTTASVGGWVRYCTRERTALPDQINQRVLVGVPSPIVSTGVFQGGRSKVPCVTQKIEIYLERVPQSEEFSVTAGWPIGGGAGWTVVIADEKYTVTRKTCASSRSLNTVNYVTPGNFTVTAPNSSCRFIPPPLGTGLTQGCFVSPTVEKVVITTTTSMTYKQGTTETTFGASQVETDLSSQ